MAARIWTALLLLGAVVFMHGLQCASAVHTGATPLLSTATAAHGAEAQMAAATAAVPAAEHTPSDSPAPNHAVSVVVAAVLHGETDTSSHSGAGHLWSVCLPVLAVGLVDRDAATGAVRTLRSADLGRTVSPAAPPPSGPAASRHAFIPIEQRRAST